MGDTRGLSRRAFLGGATATAALAATGGGALTWFVLKGDGETGPQAFAVQHGDDVYVTMTSGEEFTVRVVSSSGTELERFDGVTAATLASLESEHVTFTRSEMPTAA